MIGNQKKKRNGINEKIKKSSKLQAASLTSRILNDKVKTMTNIIYKDKKYKLPFEIPSHSTTMVKRTNGLSGQSTELPQFAALVYDHTMYMSLMTEMKDKETKQTPGFSDNQDDWQIVRNGIDFFRRYFAKEYMVLLD